MRIDILAHAREQAAKQSPPVEASPAPTPPTPANESNFQELFQSVYDGAAICDLKGVILDVNIRLLDFIMVLRADVCGHNIVEFMAGADITLIQTLHHNLHEHRFTLIQAFCLRKNGHSFPAEISVNRLNLSGQPYLCFFFRDITERRLQENQAAHNQKLESIGQLAAGIAHEINTPVQYIGDNIRFLRDAFDSVVGLLRHYGRLLDSARQGAVPPALVEDVSQAAEKSDIDFMLKEIPPAIDQSLEGVARVARIVKAMKEFSHPDSEEKAIADINKAIESTITVSRNEWKYIADMVTDLDPDLPPIPCLLGSFNQVILNLIVNAAHAVGARVGDGSKGKGTITISTRHDDDWAEVRVQDTGFGIPAVIRHRVFEPFFTTKEVGKGTGQGLSTCHAIVVKKHGGTLAFETREGEGTTFIVRLPYQAEGVSS